MNLFRMSVQYLPEVIEEMVDCLIVVAVVDAEQHYGKVVEDVYNLSGQTFLDDVAPMCSALRMVLTGHDDSDANLLIAEPISFRQFSYSSCLNSDENEYFMSFES